jgi:hypothetical protein
MFMLNGIGLGREQVAVLWGVRASLPTDIPERMR